MRFAERRYAAYAIRAPATATATIAGMLCKLGMARYPDRQALLLGMKCASSASVRGQKASTYRRMNDNSCRNYLTISSVRANGVAGGGNPTGALGRADSCMRVVVRSSAQPKSRKFADDPA